MYAFEDLFEEANITYDRAFKDRLQLIIQYKSELFGFDQVAFVTDTLIFELCRKFLGVKKVGDDKKEDYKLYFKAYRPDFELIQRTNCLYVELDECDMMEPRSLGANQK